MGWTQHTVGVQNIRAMCIIQLLLGNMGIAGGGVAALRGESNVQGSTDYGLLFHIWPGYLGAPTASLATLKAYNEKRTPTHKGEEQPELVEKLSQVFGEFPAVHVRDERHPRRGLCLSCPSSTTGSTTPGS